MVVTNFKPEIPAALGISYERLRALNPRIVLAEISAFGDTGPWSSWTGHSPLVRAVSGVTNLWTSDEATTSRHPFYDAATVFPDHVVGRITAIAALAGLIHRCRTGSGVRVHVSEAEAVVNQLATRYVFEAAQHYGIAELFEDTERARRLPMCRR
jgi:crotonobetainyl-CoA:carnitine CoA-transferase CaiB-like acyl-CoA transferase